MAPAVGLSVLAQGSAERLRKSRLPLIAAWQSNRGSHPTELPKYEQKMAPAVGFEPTTNRLTADRSTTELRWNNRGGNQTPRKLRVQSKNHPFHLFPGQWLSPRLENLPHNGRHRPRRDILMPLRSSQVLLFRVDPPLGSTTYPWSIGSMVLTRKEHHGRHVEGCGGMSRRSIDREHQRGSSQKIDELLEIRRVNDGDSGSHPGRDPRDVPGKSLKSHSLVR